MTARIGARRAVVAERADLDELMTFEACVDFANDLGREASVPDDHDGFEVVSSCAQSRRSLEVSSDTCCC